MHCILQFHLVSLVDNRNEHIYSKRCSIQFKRIGECNRSSALHLAPSLYTIHTYMLPLYLGVRGIRRTWPTAIAAAVRSPKAACADHKLYYNLCIRKPFRCSA